MISDWEMILDSWGIFYVEHPSELSGQSSNTQMLNDCKPFTSLLQQDLDTT